MPLLAANDPAVLAAEPEARSEAFTKGMNLLSARGYFFGYIGAVAVLVLCVIITFLAPTSIAAYRINIAVAGVWFLAFGAVPWLYMKTRPGPPLPAGENYFTLPWRQLGTTMRQAWQLPETFKLLACWWLLSDGMNVIGNVGAQYANAYVDWRPIPKGLGLAILLLITPIAAAIGSYFWPWAERRYGWKAHQIIALNCILMALVPAYGLLGFASRALGFRRWYDMLLGVILYGFQIGSVQSYARSVYGSLIPEGQESRFYGLYSFTDKGSSWIGPAVVAGVLQSTGNFRLAFIFPIAVLVPPAFLLMRIDFEGGAAQAREYAKTFKTAGVAMRGKLSVVPTVAAMEGGGAASSS